MADWTGGDAECDHKGRKPLTVAKSQASSTLGGAKDTIHMSHTFGSTCGRCGAIRVDSQIGLEETPALYVAKMVEVFEEVRRVLKSDGTLWLNLGDSYNAYRGNQYSDSASSKYAGFRDQPARESGYGLDGKSLKPKDLIGIPWRVAFALQEAGWWLRQDIIWSKPNPMPESVTDRCTKAHEYIFLLTKNAKYYYDNEAVKDAAAYDGRKDTVMKGSEKYAMAVVPGQAAHTFASNGHERGQTNENGDYVRNKRSVWTVTTRPFNGAKLLTDYVGADGKPYRVSPDCPIHGRPERSRTSYTLAGDEQPVALLLDSPDIDSGLALESACELTPKTSHSLSEVDAEDEFLRTSESNPANRNDGRLIEHTLAEQNPSGIDHIEVSHAQMGCKTDSPQLEHSQIATKRNNRTNKTAPVPDRAEGLGSVSAETLSSIPSMRSSAEQTDSAGRIFESSISAGSVSCETAIDPSEQTASSIAGIQVQSSEQLYCKCIEVATDHFATFPPKLIEPCILAGSREGDLVLDPFNGAGTTGIVSLQHRRRYIGIELNPEYIAITEKRLRDVQVNLF